MGMPIHAPRKRLVSLSENVDDIKMIGRKEHGKPMWDTSRKNVDFEEHTVPLKSGVLGMHTTRMQSYQKDRGGKSKIVRSFTSQQARSNHYWAGSDPHATRNCRPTTWTDTQKKNMRRKRQRTSGQNGRTIMRSLHSLSVSSSIPTRKKLRQFENYQKYVRIL